MDINNILEQVDQLYEQKKGEEAERLMKDSIAQAAREQDDGCLLQLQNELLGYYREISRKEDVVRMSAQAIGQAKRMRLEGTIPYATTLLNVATAYRACGMLQESMGYYTGVQEIYERLLKPDSMLMAGLKNNISLLYQEMGDFGHAKEQLLEALRIAEENKAVYEEGVTYANLAGTCMQLGETEEAYEYAIKAIKRFLSEQVTDSHYAAALATLGMYYYNKKDFVKALEKYKQAMTTVENCLGQNEYYRRLSEHAAACESAIATEDVQCGMSGDSAQGISAQDAVAGERTGKEGAAQKDTVQERTAQGGKAQEEACGLALSKKYYETYGKPMIEQRFPEYSGKIAVGLAGRGSDCFGYDDAESRDHDWGPEFCMWLTDETYAKIGEALQQAYEQLPEEFQGYRRAPRLSRRRRRGVMTISGFYRGLTGAEDYEQIDWRRVDDVSLAAAVNGEVFRDEEGIFTAFREKLKAGYPEEICYLKLAEGAARYAQAAQYNYPRMLRRGDTFTARMLVWDGIREAMKLQHYIEGKYPPHHKWLFRSLRESEEGREAAELLERIADRLPQGPVSGAGLRPDQRAGDEGDANVERTASAGQTASMDEVSRSIEDLGAYFAMELYSRGFISDTDSYLDAHSEELVYKASLAGKDSAALVDEIARLEFEAFDKVRNEGGRASCQNDWPTFSIMRKSQYLTWDRAMLMQYLYDFYREYNRGHNLIEEKYGRMMESTAPEKYAEIKGYFPELTQEKKAIIEQIVRMQVGWMEEFAEKYPALAANARAIHTSQDNPFDTSYETYLRGELGTYSDKMLELYGRYVVRYAQEGRNLAYDIMGNNTKMYGYANVEDAERKTGAADNGKE